MNKDIWHSKDEVPPIDTLLIVWFNYKGFPNNPEITSFGHSDWYHNKGNVEKWIKLDDLLKQSEELDRLKKKLEDIESVANSVSCILAEMPDLECYTNLEVIQAASSEMHKIFDIIKGN